MAYRWNGRKNSRSNLRRLARGQLRAAMEELTAPAAGRPDAVHDARLRLKKLRALVRLIRVADPHSYKKENAAFRDIARALSLERDRQATIDALDKLLAHAEREWDDRERLQSLLELRSRLVHAQQQEFDAAGREALLGRVNGLLDDALERVDSWTATATDETVVADGFADSYRRGRLALRVACENPTDENLHEWRKQTKYHRYQIRLFRDAWPALLDAHYDELKRLSDLLGDDHDLVLLRQATCGEWAADGELPCELARLIERRRSELQAEALPLGLLLFTEKPKQLVRRLTAYWEIRRPADH